MRFGRFSGDWLLTSLQLLVAIAVFFLCRSLLTAVGLVEQRLPTNVAANDTVNA